MQVPEGHEREPAARSAGLVQHYYPQETRPVLIANPPAAAAPWNAEYDQLLHATYEQARGSFPLLLPLFNLGVYELLRRRVPLIVACDAGADAGFHFEDLGNLIRKARVDLMVDIAIDPSGIVPSIDADGIIGPSRSNFVVGHVRYPPDGKGKPGDGWIVFVKSSIPKEAPADVDELMQAWLEGYRRVGTVSAAEENELWTFIMLRRMNLFAWIGSHSTTELARTEGRAYSQHTCALAERYLARFG